MMILFLAFLGLSQNARAADITVVDVRRNITMAENDPVYKDFYINAGPEAGFKKNLVVTAVRKVGIRDASGSNSVGDILIPVGQLKVIAVFDHVTVAREFSLLSRDDLPMLEQTGIMTGDRVDVKGSFIDTSKPKPKKIAEDKTPENVTVTTTTVTQTVAPVAANAVVQAASAVTSTANTVTPPTANVAAPPAGSALTSPAVAKAAEAPPPAKASAGKSAETSAQAEKLLQSSGTPQDVAGDGKIAEAKASE